MMIAEVTMSQRRTITLTEEQRNELTEVVASHAKPYMRERAAAILKVGAGAVAYRVALNGLLKPRDPDTVYSWLDRYREGGLKGLAIKEGRGRKPAFSPYASEQRRSKGGVTESSKEESRDSRI